MSVKYFLIVIVKQYHDDMGKELFQLLFSAIVFGMFEENIVQGLFKMVLNAFRN